MKLLLNHQELQATHILRQIARALSGAQDLDTTLDMIVQRTTDLYRVDSCTIYLLDPDGRTLRLRATTGLALNALGRATLQLGEGMTGHAALHGRPIYASHAQQNPHYKKLADTDENVFRSLLAVPLIVEDQSLGALNVQTIEPREFSEPEVDLLALIGELAAGALYKARLFEKQQQQLEELQALAQVSEAVTTPQYLDDMLHVVTEMAAKSMDAAVCSLFLLDESGKHLELRSAKRQNNAYKHRPPLSLGDGVIGQVAQTGTAVYIPDVRTDHRYLGQALAREEGLVSLLAEPLSVRGRVIGVITCYTNEEYEFTGQQRALFATLGNQTALAIENAQLVTNAAVIKEMHHRIKNNLQTVAMLIQLQMSEADKLDAREVLEISVSRIQSIAAVHEALSQRGFRLVDLREVLEQVAGGIIIGPHQQIDIVLGGEDISLPSRAATAVALVVNELILNAVEHGFTHRDHGRVELTLAHTPTDFIITVTDNGHGIPADHDQNLGLELVQTLVQDDLQGKIQFATPTIGTEVTVRIPRSMAKSDT